MKKILTAAIAALAFSLALPAFAAKTMYQMPMGTVEKATTITAPYCNAIYVEDREMGGETVAVFAAPEFCEFRGISIAGPFTELKRRETYKGVMFFFWSKAESFRPAGIGYVQEGDEVKVFDTNRPIGLSLGKVGIRAFPSSSEFSFFANVAGKADGIVERREGSIVYEVTRWYDLTVLDREILAYPGTAVVSLDGQLVGMVLGADAGRTLVLTANQLSGMICELVQGTCKG